MYLVNGFSKIITPKSSAVKTESGRNGNLESEAAAMAEAKKKTRSEQAAETKKKLTETALALFAERGYANVSIADICSAVGVTVGVFYHYFKTKSDVYRSLSVGTDEIFRQIPLAASDAPGRVLEILHHYGVVTERIGRDTMSVILTPANRLIYPNNYAAKQLRQTLREGRARGELRDTDPLDDQMSALLSLLWGQVCFWCGGLTEDLTDSIDRAAAAAVEMLRP